MVIYIFSKTLSKFNSMSFIKLLLFAIIVQQCFNNPTLTQVSFWAPMLFPSYMFLFFHPRFLCFQHETFWRFWVSGIDTFPLVIIFLKIFFSYILQPSLPAIWAVPSLGHTQSRASVLIIPPLKSQAHIPLSLPSFPFPFSSVPMIFVSLGAFPSFSVQSLSA